MNKCVCVCVCVCVCYGVSLSCFTLRRGAAGTRCHPRVAWRGGGGGRCGMGYHVGVSARVSMGFGNVTARRGDAPCMKLVNATTHGSPAVGLVASPRERLSQHEGPVHRCPPSLSKCRRVSRKSSSATNEMRMEQQGILNIVQQWPHNKHLFTSALKCS